jgi:hypothetical protein
MLQPGIAHRIILSIALEARYTSGSGGCAPQAIKKIEHSTLCDETSQFRRSPRGVPEMDDFNTLLLLVDPVTDADRRMQQRPHSRKPCRRCADVRKGR